MAFLASCCSQTARAGCIWRLVISCDLKGACPGLRSCASSRVRLIASPCFPVGNSTRCHEFICKHRDYVMSRGSSHEWVCIAMAAILYSKSNECQATTAKVHTVKEQICRDQRQAMVALSKLGADLGCGRFREPFGLAPAASWSGAGSEEVRWCWLFLTGMYDGSRRHWVLGFTSLQFSLQTHLICCAALYCTALHYPVTHHGLHYTLLQLSLPMPVGRCCAVTQATDADHNAPSCNVNGHTLRTDTAANK